MTLTEILDKCKKSLSKAINCNEKDILIFQNGNLIKELIYSKENFDIGTFTINLKNAFSFIAKFTLYEFPHCCAFMISCKASVAVDLRNKGVGTILNIFRQDLGKFLGYSSIICTDIEDNIYQRKILKKNNWKDIHLVNNKRTKNNVFLSVIDI